MKYGQWFLDRELLLLLNSKKIALRPGVVNLPLLFGRHTVIALQNKSLKIIETQNGAGNNCAHY